MSFKDTFCSSPWFHMRINNAGAYEVCRWATSKHFDTAHNITTESPLTFFKNGMSGFRKSLLDGEVNSLCKRCHQMDAHGKPSGRLRQLLKTGVDVKHFENSLLSSKFFAEFKHSNDNDGDTDLYPTDWQIDLGNFCNSACVMCEPQSSSRIAAEFKKLKIIDAVPKASWCDDEQLLGKFVTDLSSLPNIKYLHFIGGETLITPAFKTIAQALVDAGVSGSITLGFTSNLTLWDQSTVDLLKKFHQINVGLSVETLTRTNDYIRYPSKIEVVQDVLDRWVRVSQENNWLVQLRITPTCLSIAELTTVYDYAYQHNLAVESCNFIENPAHMRPSVLPPAMRVAIISKLQQWISEHKQKTSEFIINTRDPNLARVQIVQDAESYVSYLTNEPDESFRAVELVDYLKLLESNRKNSILDYLPEYEEFFKSVGY